MSDERPNILLLFTDQQRFDSLGANGNRICRTPTADGLAAAGMNFSHAFTVCALCSPARASLLTGLYPHHHGVVDNTNMPGIKECELPAHHRTFPELLKNNGYRTGYVGKWHVGRTKTPNDWGFTDYVPGIGGHGWCPPGGRFEDESSIRLAYAPERPMHARVALPLEQHPEFRQANEAVELLEQYASLDRPFFLRLDAFGPHYPHYLPEPYASMYPPSEIPPWPNFNDPLDGVPWGTEWLRNRWTVPGGIPGAPWEVYAALVARYYGHVTCVDHQMGRVLATLDRLGLADRTMVVFAADHGDLTGSHGLIQKGACAYDELYRIPLVVRWPGVVKRGQVSDAFVSLADLMPTFLEAGDVSLPDCLDGRSFMSLLGGETPRAWPDDVLAESLATQAGDIRQKILRTRTHKLALNAPGPDELFDLERDPGELRNVIGEPDAAAARSDLASRLHRRMAKTCDPLLSELEPRLAAYEQPGSV